MWKKNEKHWQIESSTPHRSFCVRFTAYNINLFIPISKCWFDHIDDAHKWIVQEVLD